MKLKNYLLENISKYKYLEILKSKIFKVFFWPNFGFPELQNHSSKTLPNMKNVHLTESALGLSTESRAPIIDPCPGNPWVQWGSKYWWKHLNIVFLLVAYLNHKLFSCQIPIDTNWSESVILWIKHVEQLSKYKANQCITYQSLCRK